MLNKLLSIVLLLTLLACEQVAPPQEPPPPPLRLEPPPPVAETSLAALLAAEPPARDLADLARRLKGIEPATPLKLPPQVGDVAPFYYLVGGSSATQVDAELLFQTDDINFWVEQGARVDMRDVEEATYTIESDLLPRLRQFFGTEAQPGIDGDSRVNLLHLKKIGGDGGDTETVGYFSAADLYPRDVNPYSNEREMLYVSLAAAPLRSDAYYQVIAHEMQHMIQAHTDRNEFAWLDEGLAELAAYVTGYAEIDSVNSYAELTDVQLNDWSNGSGQDLAHYGSSFLFVAYFLDRFGSEAMQALVRSDANGFHGFAEALTDLGLSLTVEDLFLDWLAANYLQSAGRGSEPYSYELVDVPALRLSAEHSRFPAAGEGGVHQFGADLIGVQSDQPLTLIFTGTRQTGLLPTDPQHGDYFVTTYPADRSDMSLTRAFDLAQSASAAITLSFATWYEIEEGWDYGYITVSDDAGGTWQMLPSIYSTSANPQGNNYGVGLTGNSGGEAGPLWTTVEVDLSAYAGKTILLRFEYVTDDAIFEAGWAIDDLRIDAIGYAEDFEQGLGNWQTAGWVRHGNVLPQRFLLQVILLSDDEQRIERLQLDDDQSGAFVLPFDAEFDEAIITIAGATPVTTQRAAYRYELRD